ncbi:hypothetical protein KY284_010588 [Solanum tuberosum]|nr:hypothetical protein KY284_010588 [Solanum tuberosum]
MEELQIKSVDLASNQLKSKGNTGKEILTKKGQAQFNGIMSCNKEADEVEDEANALVKKKSIWDDFYIAKLANAGYKLEYVTPTKKGEIVEIEMEEIRSEITYWGNVVVCYEFGAHPPFTVIQGYIQRLWGSMGGIFHFDNKPFIVKEWTLEVEFTKVELQIVLIWVKFPGLDFKYWSREGLSKIVEMETQVLVVVKFKKEKGRLVEQHVQLKKRGPKPVQIPPKQEDGQRGGNTQKWQAKVGAQVAQQLQTQQGKGGNE